MYCIEYGLLVPDLFFGKPHCVLSVVYVNVIITARISVFGSNIYLSQALLGLVQLE